MQQFRSLLKTASALLAMLALFSVPSLAQTFRGTINGTVTDTSGAVIPGAKVTATDVSTAVVRDTVSSSALVSKTGRCNQPPAGAAPAFLMSLICILHHHFLYRYN